MTEKDVHRLQTALNEFTTRFSDLGFTKLMVDGQMGVATKKRLHDVKYMVGYLQQNLDTPADENFFKRAKHPNQVMSDVQREDAIKRGQQRRDSRRKWLRRNKIRAFLKPGVGTFDGKPVAKCVIPVLQWCRNNGWKGQLVSGYRSPAFSEQLCFRMCGHSTCPGRCAGRSTNHAYSDPSRFAIDVSDYATFGRVVAHCPIAPHIHNSLPNDLVHFSPSGH
jgi:hypothetical protein